MFQHNEKNDEIPFTNNEFPMAESQKSGQSQSEETNIVEDIASKNDIHEGAVPLSNTPWRNRSIPGPIRPEDSVNETRGEAPLGFDVTTDGIINLYLHENIRVDMTLDRAIRIMNYRSSISVTVSASGNTAALMHPNGNVYQYGSRVAILAYDKQTHENNKYAKMWYKGVSFTSDQCGLVYLVDSAGTRVTTDTFYDLKQDFSYYVFSNESLHGPSHVQEAKCLIKQSKYWITNDGTENWVINKVHVSQTVDGLVRIGRNHGQYYLRTSPNNGSAGITTPFLHCTGSLRETGHLFVRRGDRRMHYDGSNFIVRYARHSAGFDGNVLKIY